ncbi:MAG: M42 family metallopeptidase [Limnochordia bacterium]|jgi:putative aminopeptidase FrvX|nr:M42 family metallopeptidase [Bacillota bacterium]HOB08054.1 M42 family metallopeptidase [Limnochordia bacterium]NLH32249.1 M42 family metallopeptidase [Bacillota bacterium]HPT92473.1 M42 family metallopeptidase [Limnochordia bacterium]HPZ30251.1 M42 family metallopeptidase [Limnochordia bacterium]
MKNLIKDLVESYGPTGFETEVTNKIRTYIADKVDECYVDALGNLIARKKGSGKKVMFSAHADEIGVIVTYIDDDGFLRFSNVGGLNLLTLLGGRVRFANGVIGVIGKEKGELKDLTLDKLFIDIGAATKDEAQKKVSIGDFAVFHREFADLGQRLVAKSMDDRIGCAVLVEAIRRLDHSDHDLYFVFSAQEEVGLRGARTAAYSIDPDLGIAIDVTRTGDTPEAPRMDVSLGKGAAIKVKDSSVIAHPKVKNLMVRLAEADQIKYQLEVLEAGGTDAGAIHLTKSGVPSGTISIPCRYVHSPSEMVDLDDVENCVKLILAICRDSLDEF